MKGELAVHPVPYVDIGAVPYQRFGHVSAAHHYVCVNQPTGLLARLTQRLTQRLQPSLAIPVVGVNGPTLITTAHDRVSRARVFDSPASRHPLNSDTPNGNVCNVCSRFGA